MALFKFYFTILLYLRMHLKTILMLSFWTRQMGFGALKPTPRQQQQAFTAGGAERQARCNVLGTWLRASLSWLMCSMWAPTGPTPRHYSIPSAKELHRVHVPLWLIYRVFFFFFFRRRKMHLRSALNKHITH